MVLLEVTTGGEQSNGTVDKILDSQYRDLVFESSWHPHHWLSTYPNYLSEEFIVMWWLRVLIMVSCSSSDFKPLRHVKYSCQKNLLLALLIVIVCCVEENFYESLLNEFFRPV